MRNADWKFSNDRQQLDRSDSAPAVTSEEDLSSFMTVEDVAELLRINKSTVYRMAKEGRLPATRVGRQWRFRQSSLERYLDGGGEYGEERRSAEPLRRAAARW